MVWPEVSIEDFPPERDDEPVSLRQDILDELTDHFTCALNRELLKNSDEQLARQRVLNQFGDPIKIARQLWFDAMKEKIMSQRIMTGVSVVMAVCCLAVVGIAWSLMNQGQDINQKMLEQLAAITDRPQPVDTTKIDQKMLNQLEQLNQKQTIGESSKLKEMNQMSFQLVQETKGGKPAANFTGKLTYQGKSLDSFSLEAVSDATGKLDFGKLPWGNYYFYLLAPWDEVYHASSITLIPGRDYSQTIVCPTAPPAEVPVQFQVNWSDKQKSEDRFLVCDFRALGPLGGTIRNYALDSARKIGDDQWTTIQNQTQKSKGVYLVSSNNEVSLCPLDRQGDYGAIDPDTLKQSTSINIIQGEYALPLMYLIPKGQLKYLTLLNGSASYEVFNISKNKVMAYNPYNPTDREGTAMYGGGLANQLFKPRTTTLLIPSNLNSPTSDGLAPASKNIVGIQLPHRLNFSASKDQPNLWKIKLPSLNFLNSESSSENKVQ